MDSPRRFRYHTPPVSLVLITGGAGFIGSHVAARLLAAGVRVRVLDSFDPYYDVRLKRGNVEELAAAGRSAFELVEGDIRDAAVCRRAVHGATAVIHLAALAGVRPSIQDPVRYADVNVTGTQVLLQQIEDRDTVFVFGSSSSVYGGNTKVPFAESDPVDRPVSPYAATKRAGEGQCHAWHHLRGNRTVCLRFFTVYGPRQRPEMAIHKFVDAVHRKRPIPFYGDGSTRRDYTYIDDIVDGVLRALDRCEGYEIYNLGESQTTTLAELVRLIGEVTGIEPVLDRQPMQPGDVVMTCADVSRARNRLGYEPRTPVREGLERFVRWYRDARR